MKNLIILGSFLLCSCALTPIASKVNTPARKDQTFAIGSVSIAGVAVDRGEAVDALRAALKRKGLVPAAAGADILVSFRFEAYAPQRVDGAYSVPTFGPTGGGMTQFYGSDGQGNRFSGTAYQSPTWGQTGSASIPYSEVQRLASATLQGRNRAGKLLWEYSGSGRIDNRTPSDAVSAVASRLASQVKVGAK
jgi:hypothetical protein